MEGKKPTETTGDRPPVSVIGAEEWVMKRLESIRRQMQQNLAKNHKPPVPSVHKPDFVGKPERFVGIDKQGRTIKEVWVSGRRHLVVD